MLQMTEMVVGNVANGSEQELESDIAKVLQFRYGDGLVYLPRNQPESLFKIGYLTRKGRYLIAKYQFS